MSAKNALPVGNAQTGLLPVHYTKTSASVAMPTLVHPVFYLSGLNGTALVSLATWSSLSVYFTSSKGKIGKGFSDIACSAVHDHFLFAGVPFFDFNVS